MRYTIALACLAMAFTGCSSTNYMSDNESNNKMENVKLSRDAYIEAKSNPDEETKLICRNEVSTGTRFTKRVCRTKEELESQDPNVSHTQDANPQGYQDPQKPASL